MNPDFTFIWPLSCLKDGDHLSLPSLVFSSIVRFWLPDTGRITFATHVPSKAA